MNPLISNAVRSCTATLLLILTFAMFATASARNPELGTAHRVFQIEAFKYKAELDPKYSEKTWKILEHGINEIYNHNDSALNFEELYRNGYNMVLHKYGDKLYAGLESTMTHHLQKMAQRIEAAQDDRFLEELNASWKDYDNALLLIRDVLMYMDRTYIPSNCRAPIRKLGRNLWRDVIIRSSEIQPRLQITLTELILRDRNGEVINQGLMRNIITMLTDLGLSVNELDFEKPFLDVSAVSFGVQPQELIECCKCDDYQLEVSVRPSK